MSDTIPQHIKDKIAKKTDDYAFKIPFDGTTSFYDQIKLNAHKDGAEFGYHLAQQELEAEGCTVRIVMDGTKWYWCKCESCGWENSSEYAGGGQPIGETGDYTDPACPICFSNKIEGESEFVKEETYNTQIVKIPLENFIAPYQKAPEKAISREVELSYLKPELDGAKKEIEILNNALSLANARNRELVEGHNQIVGMKRLPTEINDNYAFNRCWRVSQQLIAKYDKP